MPTSNETTIVRVSSSRPWFGSVKPTASKSLKSPFASARPENEADDRRDRSDDERLDHDRPEHLAARAAERPDRGELARPLRDRDRERVRDHEAADEERDPREGEQEALEEGDELVRPLGVLLRLLGRERPRARGGRICLDVLDELRLGDARLRPHRDLVELPLLVEDPLRRRQVEAGERRAADRRDRAEPEEAGDAETLDRPVALDADHLAEVEVLLVGGRPGRSTTSSVPRPLALRSVSGLKTESPFAIEKPRFGAPP